MAGRVGRGGPARGEPVRGQGRGAGFAVGRGRRTGFVSGHDGRRGARPRSWRTPWASKRGRRLTLAVVALAAVLGGGWLWLRDSSLVSVEHVTVTGTDGPDAAQIRGALTAAARTMSTLDVHLDRLRTAVAPYPVVRDLRVSTQFPHGMRIAVVEEIPVAIVMENGRAVPVAGDGVVLHDAGSAPALPVLELGAPPGGPRLTEATARGAVALLAAAPYPVLAKLSQVSHDAEHGLTAQLRGGPAIYFGDASEPSAKWRAALDVLADPGSAGATYIDVSDPRRPAAGAGGGSSTASQSGSTAATSASTAGG
jgi:cell division protein FtsQ